MSVQTAGIAAREGLGVLQADLAGRYWQNDPVEDLLVELSDGMDTIITGLYETCFSGLEDVALFAVGGYGRRELHPYSDIDLLIVARKPADRRREIEQFVQAVFDLNIDVGYSVRDIRSCRTEARNDITVATAMFERRFMCGATKLKEKLDKIMSSPRLWPVDKFFRAKEDEQSQRHKHYDNVEYNLEPNIKTSPGGLRDIHTALWICRRKFQTTDVDRLVALGVLTSIERDWLVEGRRFIWWVRFGLHLIAGRKEDHLQFAYQRELAERLGFVDTDAQRGVERFMHHYYRHVLALTEVNDIIIQYFNESIVHSRASKPKPINERFQIVDDYIETAHDGVFREHPSALLELFVIIANREDIAGVRAKTIRQVRDNRTLIDNDFRNNPEHTKLFMDLLKAPYKLVSQLTRMRRYGILGSYIPEFGRVIGQMQHDLFHIYTVDAHTMMVLTNMRRFRYPESATTYPVAHHCVHTVPKVELLYIAGLYHDIGKGRGGDHSTLGAEDARAFCLRHGLSNADTDLVCWLVEKHLYMSSKAQREDIYDPEVVHGFAQAVKSEMRLDYLYALTVADINATNPTLWNSWRATLLRQLYTETRKALRRGLESSADRNATVAAYQERAMDRLAEIRPDLKVTRIRDLWSDLGDDFFLRHSPVQIAHLTELLSEHDVQGKPLVTVQDTHGDLPGEGATQVYVYTMDQPMLFALTVVSLSQFELSVVDATINTSTRGVCFDTYTVLDQDGNPLAPESPLRERIAEGLRDNIVKRKIPKLNNNRLLPRQLRDMSHATEVSLKPTGDDESSTLIILASDRPGLLATIGLLFAELGLQLLSARITTLGERIEDTFVIQTSDGAPVAAGEDTYTLEQSIRQRLDTALGV